MARDTWDSREKVWLEQIDDANRLGEGWVPDEFESGDESIWRAAVYDWDALKDGGFIAVQVDQRNGAGKPVVVHGTRLTAKGRECVGRWPTDAGRAVEDLLSRVDEMIAVAPPEQRSKLVEVRAGLLGVGRDLLVDIAAAAAAKAAGL